MGVSLISAPAQQCSLIKIDFYLQPPTKKPLGGPTNITQHLFLESYRDILPTWLLLLICPEGNILQPPPKPTLHCFVFTSDNEYARKGHEWIYTVRRRKPLKCKSRKLTIGFGFKQLVSLVMTFFYSSTCCTFHIRVKRSFSCKRMAFFMTISQSFSFVKSK